MSISTNTLKIARDIFKLRVKRLARKYGYPAVLEHAGLLQASYNSILPIMLWRAQFINNKES